jgi:hypothetical protein
MPPRVKKILDEYGTRKIINMKICKNPIRSVFETAMNWITLGSYEQNKKKLNYDKMYHLYILLELENGEFLTYEKNQVVTIEKYKKESDDRYSECIEVDLKDKVITLNELLYNTVQRLGEPNIWLYNGENSKEMNDVGNCQHFIDNTLTANGLNSRTYKDFVLQDANKIIGELPSVTKGIIRNITDLGAMVDRLIHGGQRRRYRKI